MLTELFSLTGRAALVTGASSGIGLHTARLLALAGASVVLAARRVDKIAEAVHELKAIGCKAAGIALDVSDRGSIGQAWIAAGEAAGQPIDIVINNAGILYAEKFIDQDLDEVDRLVQTNFVGAFAMAQQAARAMSRRGSGVIINVASTSGLRAAGQLSSYGALKAGLIHLTQTMALELAGRGVRVNGLCPGNIKTEMHATFEAHGFDQSILKRIPMRKFGEPHHLDGAMLLLASDAGAYITGAILPVDGGQVLSWM